MHKPILTNTENGLRLEISDLESTRTWLSTHECSESNGADQLRGYCIAWCVSVGNPEDRFSHIIDSR